MERLGSEECFFVSLPKELESKRDYMAKFLLDVGMKPTIPEGGYFMLADWTPLGKTSMVFIFMKGNQQFIFQNQR